MKNYLKIKRLLKEISKEINNQEWRKYLGSLSTNFDLEFEDASIDKRYKYMSGLDALFSGMGSLNDGVHSKEVEEKLESLYFHVNQELIRLWALLGNETHDPSSFQRYKIGTVVKLIVGKPRFIELNGSIKYFPDQKWVHELKWVIINYGYPDITNMPQYTLERQFDNGIRHMVVRHDAVKPTNKGLLNRFKKLMSRFHADRL